MPWKECDKVSERLKFIGRLLSGEKMTDVCLELGISRVTGYKIWNRYKQEGLKAMNDRSSRPWRLANQTPASIERAIVEIKRKYPTWGAPKILAILEKQDKGVKLPARSTVHAILDRHGLVKRRRKNRLYKSKGTSLITVDSPNQLWCADFKGHFKMGNSNYCYPLTITDQHSRYLISCEALESAKEKNAVETFKRVFEEYGMPNVIRTDNGVPFAARSLFGLSKLSILWLRLGIDIERIEPGHPEQNGRHERMHKTLKEEVTRPPGRNLLQQQEMLDHFRIVFNNERPHEALQMKCPAEVYQPSSKAYPKILEEYNYSKFDFTKRVTKCGTIKLQGGRKIFISEIFGGQDVGIREIEDGIWSVTFMDFELGYFSSDSTLFNPGINPFLPIINQNV
ncbi:Integrase core domain protein [compost metagenome]